MRLLLLLVLAGCWPSENGCETHRHHVPFVYVPVPAE